MKHRRLFPNATFCRHHNDTAAVEPVWKLYTASSSWIQVKISNRFILSVCFDRFWVYWSRGSCCKGVGESFSSCRRHVGGRNPLFWLHDCFQRRFRCSTVTILIRLCYWSGRDASFYAFRVSFGIRSLAPCFYQHEASTKTCSHSAAHKWTIIKFKYLYSN